MATTAILPVHAGKGRPIAAAFKMSVDYIKNPNKTDDGEWVTAYACDPLIADDEFLFSKNRYATITGREQGARDVLAYHLRIAFKPGETDAKTANRIGYELAMKLTRGDHAFVCCTHVDKLHMHTHILVNAVSLDYTKKFRNFKGSAFAIRRIADYLCVENGLSIVENPKPSRGSYANWKGTKKPQSNREKLERIIDAAIENSKDYNAFIAAMIAAGCDVKQGANLAFKIPGAERFARCKSLGEDYTEDAIRERLAGTRKVVQRRQTADEKFIPFVITRETKFGLLIDIQQKVQEGKGAAYEHWAKLYNLKQMARTLIYLQENGLDDYNELAKKANAVSSDFDERLARIKTLEKRMSEISELQKHIGTYGKTREVYKQYRASGKDVGFYEIHRADITLHLAAKKHFNERNFTGKLPSINTLRQEWATLNAEKKALYRDYHELKDQRKELLTAKDTCERILGINKNASERDAERDRPRKKSHER